MAEPLSGMIHTGPSAQGRAGTVTPFVNTPMASPSPFKAQATAAAPEMSLLIALGVVLLVSVFVTAVLMTFAYDPDGWPVLAYVTTPTPTTSLIAQSLLAIGALFVTGKLAATGVRRWNAQLSGARGLAVFFAVVAGAFLFAALQLGRAAF